MSVDISEITDSLLVGAQPRAEDSTEIAARNVRLIISMIGGARPPQCFGDAPLSCLWLPSYDTFLTPIGAKKLIQGVEAARRVISEGGRVLVYCQKGRHRSVIMAAAILIASGYSADEAVSLLRARRQVSDPQTWYIRRQIRRFEALWKARNSGANGAN